MSIYKKRFFLLASIGFLFPSLLVGINVLLDPAEIYHKSFFRPRCTTFRTVETTVGQINQYLDEYNGVIFGSSLSTNFDLQQIKNKQGIRFFKAARDGVAAKSMNLMVRHLFRKDKKRQIKTIWWELYHQKLGTEDFIKDNFTTYLLNESVSDDLPYLMSFNTMGNGIKVLRGKCASGDLASWRVDSRHIETQRKYQSPENIKALNERIAARQQELKDYKFEPIYVPAIENYVLPIIHENQDREFIFYVPPTTLAALVFFETKELNRYFSMIGRLVEESEKYPNIKIYLPVWNKDLITDATHYRDDLHYVGEINDMMANDLVERRYQVTKQNYAAFVAEMSQWIKNEKMKSEKP